MQHRTKECRHGRLMHLLNDAYIGRSLDVYGEYSEGEIDLFPARSVRGPERLLERH